MDRFKLIAMFTERFDPNGSIDVSALPDKELVVLLLTHDLKTRNLSYVQIMNRYGVTHRIARTIKHRIISTRRVSDKPGG